MENTAFRSIGNTTFDIGYLLYSSQTKIGGLLSRDFTRGYGPQEYLLKKAVKGTYEVKIQLYSPLSEALEGVTVSVKIYTNFGRSREEEYIKTVKVNKVKQLIPIATIIR